MVLGGRRFHRGETQTDANINLRALGRTDQLIRELPHLHSRIGCFNMNAPEWAALACLGVLLRLSVFRVRSSQVEAGKSGPPADSPW